MRSTRSRRAWAATCLLSTPGLWSVGFDLGSFAYDVGPESRARVQELEAAVDARRDELRELQRSADAPVRRVQGQRRGEARWAGGKRLTLRWMTIGTTRAGGSPATGGSSWGGSWALVAVVLGLGLVELWVSWRDRRALAQPTEGM